MAGYTPRSSGSNSQGYSRNSSAPQQSRTSDAGGKAALFSTGLFTPDNEKSKAIGTVQVKETITIPAGAYINLYQSDKKSDKSPAFKLQVRESTKKMVK